MTKELTVKTPGKLMVAGEFAVLEPYQKLVVMAVDRFVFTTIAASEQNVVDLLSFDMHHLTWELQGNHVVFDTEDSRLTFIQAALETTFIYLHEKNMNTKPFAISIRSELDDEVSGAKYGLGSSAAVVTSLVKAILTYCLESKPDNELVFKLASIAHVRTQGNGSGADIAASTYGGVLAYTSFQADWLLDELAHAKDMVSLVEKQWRYLSIQPMTFPTEVAISVGWTGKPASTKNLVNDILSLKKTSPNQYAAFLEHSRVAVAKIVQGMQENHVAVFLAGITENRYALAKLGEDAAVDIETEKLAQLSDIAEQYGGAGKLSGAGGGDCGLAFVEKEVNVRAMHKAWEDAGIQLLQIHVYKGN